MSAMRMWSTSRVSGIIVEGRRRSFVGILGCWDEDEGEGRSKLAVQVCSWLTLGGMTSRLWLTGLLAYWLTGLAYVSRINRFSSVARYTFIPPPFLHSHRFS